MTNQVFGVGDVASALLGAGLTKINDDLNVALLLIGVGVGLKILVAVLQKYEIPVSFAKGKK